MATNVIAITESELAEVKAHLKAIFRILGEVEPAPRKRAKPAAKLAAPKKRGGWPKGKKRGPRLTPAEAKATGAHEEFAPTTLAQ